MSAPLRGMRIVVKVGSSTLTDRAGRLDHAHMSELVAQIARVRGSGAATVLVTSGAIAAGVERLELPARPTEMSDLQATAAVGQAQLIKSYERLFAEHDVPIGQVLLTRHETTHRQQYLYACRTLERLIELGTVPVVNENDTTAVDEIRFGDNDLLAALVAIMIRADLVVMLTDIDGVYTTDPKRDDSASRLEDIDVLTDELLEGAGGPGSGMGSGGMYSKIEAARVLMKAGVPLVVTDGRRPEVLVDAAEGRKVGTMFAGDAGGLSGRKLWIAFGGHASGTIVIDGGACDALVERKKSLLAAGVVAVEGDFAVDDSVAIRVEGGDVIARGLAGIPSEELRRVMGMRSDEAADVLPGRSGQEVVHRDRLVIL